MFLSSNAGNNCAESCFSQKKTKAGLNQKKAAKQSPVCSTISSGTASEVIKLQAQHNTNKKLSF